VISTSLFFSIYDNWTTPISLQLNVIEHLSFIFIFFAFSARILAESEALRIDVNEIEDYKSNIIA